MCPILKWRKSGSFDAITVLILSHRRDTIKWPSQKLNLILWIYFNDKLIIEITSTILEQELRERGWQFGVWPWSPILFCQLCVLGEVTVIEMSVEADRICPKLYSAPTSATLLPCYFPWGNIAALFFSLSHYCTSTSYQHGLRRGFADNLIFFTTDRKQKTNTQLCL